MMMVGVPCRNRDRIIIYHFKSKIMKGTEAFKRTIGEYLQVRANTDEIFAQRMKKEGKTLEVDLSDYKIVQCRGKYNHDTPYHDAILKLMNDNMGMIKEINDKKRRVI